MIDTILVAIDFSDQSRAALASATSVAATQRSKLILLWVEGDPARAPSGAAIYGSAVQEIERLVTELRARSMERLDALAEPLRQQGLEVETLIETGHPDEVIVEVAARIGVDLIVTGTKGLTGVKRFFLGSVAEKVIRAAPVDVLVARGDSESFRRILVPTDFSPTCERALDLAVALAGPAGPDAPACSIDLLHAWQYPAGTHGIHDPDDPGGPLGELRDQIIRTSEAHGKKLVDRHADSGCTVQFVHQHGPAAAAVQDQLEKHPYDLVVMGTHGHRGFRRFLLGSVSEATVRHAPCSVLVVHAERVARPG